MTIVVCSSIDTEHVNYKTVKAFVIFFVCISKQKLKKQLNTFIWGCEQRGVE